MGLLDVCRHRFWIDVAVSPSNAWRCTSELRAAKHGGLASVERSWRCEISQQWVWVCCRSNAVYGWWWHRTLVPLHERWRLDDPDSVCVGVVAWISQREHAVRLVGRGSSVEHLHDGAPENAPW